jgi:hypothetical protein
LFKYSSGFNSGEYGGRKKARFFWSALLTMLEQAFRDELSGCQQQEKLFC